MQNPTQYAARLNELAASAEYKPLTEIVADVKATSDTGLRELGNFSHPILSAQKLARVEEFLASENIDKVAFVGLGSEALVVQIHEDEVLRIYNQSAGERPNIPEMLQPHAVAHGDGLVLEFILKADTKDVTQDDRQALIASALESGYRFDDSKLSNIGKLNDGTPIIIDGDALTKIPEIIHPIAKPILRAINKLMGNEINPTHDYAAAQEQHRESVGLVEGKFGKVNLEHNIAEEKSSPEQESTQWRDEILNKENQDTNRQR